MKRILHVICFALMTGLIPFTTLAGQGKKGEQKIKVIIADGSENTIVVDTVFNDDFMNDSIKLKDGKSIIITGNSKKIKSLKDEGKENMYLMVTSEDGDNDKVHKEITIVSSDPATWTAAEYDGTKSFTYMIKTDKPGIYEADSEMTTYVIKKDGMEISISGTDYNKVKELANDIEGKMDSKQEMTEKKAIKRK